MCSLPTIGDGGDMQRRSRPVSSGTDQYFRLVPTTTGPCYTCARDRGWHLLRSKMLVSALVLALATVTGLSLPDAGWLPIWESRRRACTSMSPV